MSKEWRIVRTIVRKADIIIEVVDSRDPWGTRSHRLEKIVNKMGKKLLIVINKADLVPRYVLERWVEILRREYPSIYISASKRLGTRLLWKYIKMLSPKRPVTVAIVGLPNVGKSTILNILKGSHSAGTSPIPGYTKHVMIVRASTWLRVIDTPGVIPRVSKEELIIKSALRPEALEDPLPAATKLLEIILEKNPGILKKTYGFATSDPYEFIEKYAKKRGLLLRGGRLNIEEAARIIIRDWQSGKLNFYFKPEDYGLSSHTSSSNSSNSSNPPIRSAEHSIEQ